MKKQLLSLAFLLPTFFAQSQANLQLALSFDNSLVDKAKGRTVKAYNSPSFGADALGNPASALVLTGKEYLEVDPNFIEGDGSYSVSLWFNSANQIGYNYILNSGASNSNAGFVVATFYKQLLVSYRTKTSTINNTVASIPFEVQANKWYHLAGVYNAIEKNLSVYIDGDSVATFEPKEQSNAEGFPKLYIGVQGNFLDSYFHGKLDELYVFNKALTPREVATLASVLVTGLADDAKEAASDCKDITLAVGEELTLDAHAVVLDVQSKEMPSISTHQHGARYRFGQGLYLVRDGAKGCTRKLLVR